MMNIDSKERRNRRHSVLRDIHQTFLKRLFGEDTKTSDGLCGEQLLKCLRAEFNGDPGRFLSSIEQFIRKGNDRFLDAAAEVEELLDIHKQTGHLIADARTKDLLTSLFGKLVGFSLMKVDRIYRQIYYVEIYHQLLAKNLREAIKQAVLVPFNQGSVGFAARIGGLSLSNSLNDPRGTVASEDLLQGNISIMMSGIGRQLIGERVLDNANLGYDEEGSHSQNDDRWSDFQLDEPEHRWTLLAEQGRWDDSLVVDHEQCAAVLFCYFPIKEIFPNYLSTSPARIRQDGSRCEEGSDPPALYELFTDITRTYEHSLLGDIYHAQAKFVTKRTDEAIKRKIKTLDILASLQTTDNPTGGLLSLRSDQHDCRICVPRLESNLARPLFEHQEIQRKLTGRSTDERSSNGDPVLSLLTRNVVSINLGQPVDGQSLVTLLLHCRGGSDSEQLTSLNIDRGKIQTLGKFFSLIREKYYTQFESLFSGRQQIFDVEERSSFERAKVAIDAYEGVAAYIARIVCSGIEGTMRLPFFAALTQEGSSGTSCDLDTKRNDQVSVLANVVSKLIEQTFQGGSTLTSNLDNLGEEIKYIDLQTAELRDRIVGVSAYYWAAHQIEPLDTDSPVTPLNKIGEDVSSRVNSAWQREGPAMRRLLRMLCLKSMMIDKETIHIAYPVKNKRTSAEYQYVIPVPESLDSRDALNFHFDSFIPPVNEGEANSFSFCFATRQGTTDTEVARTVWRVRPKYRIATLCLNKTNIEASLRDSIVSWDQHNLDSDEMICSMSKYLDARKVNLKDMADESEPGLFDDWKVSFYTIDGRWTNLGQQLVRRMKDYEDHLQATERVAEEKGRADTAEALVSGTSHSLKIPFQVAKDLAEKGLADQAARILKIGVSFVTVGAYVQDYRRAQRKKVAQLREAYFGLKPTAVGEVDSETWTRYGEHLEENLYRLSDKLAHGAYCRPAFQSPRLSKGREWQVDESALEYGLVQQVNRASDELLSDEFLVKWAPARDFENPDALLLEKCAVQEWLELASYYVRLRDGGEIIKQAETYDSPGLWLDWKLLQRYVLRHANQIIFAHDTEAAVFLSAFTEIVANAIANAHPQNRHVTVSFSTESDEKLIVRVENNLSGKPAWNDVREYEKFAASHSGVVGARTVKWACESLGWTFNVRSIERNLQWFQEIEFAAEVHAAFE